MPKKRKSIKQLTPVIVTVSDEMLKNIHRVAGQLAEKGLKVHRVMPVTGVIAGSSAASKMSALRNVEGVTSVEEELVAKLPPADSPVQ